MSPLNVTYWCWKLLYSYIRCTFKLHVKVDPIISLIIYLVWHLFIISTGDDISTMVYLTVFCQCLASGPKLQLIWTVNSLHSIHSCCITSLSSAGLHYSHVVNASKMLQYNQKRNCQFRPSHAPPWRVLFFGTDEFALPHLKALNENRFVLFSL